MDYFESKQKLCTRANDEEADKFIVEGYFVRFDDVYDMGDGYSEQISPEAFSGQLTDNDVRCLINHDTALVLGRTSAGTLELRQDETGIYGICKINPSDSDAVNLYERVKRGDVSQASFGFEILDYSADYKENGAVRFTVKKLRLHEVSVCTFPAYEKTSISARSEESESQIEKIKKFADWKMKAERRIALWH